MSLSKPTSTNPFTLLFLISIFIFSPIQSQKTSDYVTEAPSKSYPVTSGSPHFAIDLDYPQAFEVTIEAYNGNTSATGFCEVTPSQIIPKLLWNGPVNNAYEDLDTTTEGEDHSYDNIEFHMGYYFIVDSLTFNVIAIKDFNDPTSYITITSEAANEYDNEQLEDTYLIIDPDQHNLYILTRKLLLYYSLTDFVNAVDQKQPIPTIKNEATNYKGFSMVLSTRYYRNRLYVVGDKVVEVYKLEKNGQVTPQLKFDHKFFEEVEVSISDIAFKGNYAYALDQERGVLVVDISKEDDPKKKKMKEKYIFEPEDTRETQKGQFIEIVGDSLHIVSAGSRRPHVFEYIIRGDPELLSLDFNRKFELMQTIRDSYSDSNFLFLLTGFFNIVTKHSIPGRFQSESVEEYLEEYWPVFGAKAMTSQVGNLTSTVAILNENQITLMEFAEVNPKISCATAGVPAGLYSFKVSAAQKDCEARQKAVYTEYNDVCYVKQEIQLVMIDASEDVGNTAEDKKTVDYLAIGIGVMIFLMVLFICLFSKYRNQYRRLEDKIKFHNIENTSTDHKMSGRIAAIDEESPANARNQAHLRVQVHQKKGSPSKVQKEEKSKEGTTSEEEADKPFH